MAAVRITDQLSSMISEVCSQKEKLRRVMDIHLPSIVVIGDQNSGKCRLLELLAGLDAKDEVKAKVPMALRLENQTFLLFTTCAYAGGVGSTGKLTLSEAMARVRSKKIKNFGLEVKNEGVPDLLFIDLPEIIGVPSDDTKEMMLPYMNNKENVILNIVSATCDMSSCQSIKMLTDGMKERTLLVITCPVDGTPDDIIKMVDTLSLDVGLGVMYVRDRINNETYANSIKEEKLFFRLHERLAWIDKSMTGVVMLAEKLVRIQLMLVLNSLPRITNSIDDKLKDTISKLGKLPMLSGGDTVANFVFMLNSAMEKLRGQLIKQRSHEYNTRLIDLLHEYYEELQMNLKFSDNFLKDELNEIKSIDSLPKSPFASILGKKLEGVSEVMIGFVESVCKYIDNLTKSSLIEVFGDNIELMSVVNQRASFVLKKMKMRFIEWVNRSLEMEKVSSFYTCDTSFSDIRNNLMSGQKNFLKAMHGRKSSFSIEGEGVIDITHLHGITNASLVQAYELRAQSTAYLKVIVKRLVDSTAVQLRFLIEGVMNREMQSDMINGLLAFGHGLEKLLKPTESMREEKKKLESDIQLLTRSRNIMTQLTIRLVLVFVLLRWLK